MRGCGACPLTQRLSKEDKRLGTHPVSEERSLNKRRSRRKRQRTGACSRVHGVVWRQRHGAQGPRARAPQHRGARRSASCGRQYPAQVLRLARSAVLPSPGEPALARQRIACRTS